MRRTILTLGLILPPERTAPRFATPAERGTFERVGGAEILQTPQIDVREQTRPVQVLRVIEPRLARLGLGRGLFG